MIEWIPEDINFIGRFENYVEDMKTVLELSGISIDDVNIPHTNKTSHNNYREYYDEDTKNMVGEMYKDDIVRFGYTF